MPFVDDFKKLQDRQKIVVDIGNYYQQLQIAIMDDEIDREDISDLDIMSIVEEVLIKNGF